MTCTLTGPCKTADQANAVGHVTITRRRTAEDGTLYVSTPIEIPLVNGTFSKSGLQGGTYRVAEWVGAYTSYTVVLPDTGTVSLADLAPASPAPELTQYALLSSLATKADSSTVAANTAAITANTAAIAAKADLVAGTIPDAQLPAGLARDTEVTAAVNAQAAANATTYAAIPTVTAVQKSLGRDKQARRHVEHPQEIYPPWFGLAAGTIGVAANGAYFLRWIAPHDCVVYGVTLNVTTSSGNIAISVYNSSWELLSTSGSTACPAAGMHGLHLPSGGVAVEAGKVYYLTLHGDNITFRVAAWSVTNNVIGTRMVGGTVASGMMPPPAYVLTVAQSLAIGTPTAGPVMVPMLSPGMTAFPPTPLTMSINASAGQVFARDSASGRVFGNTGNTLTYSDDNGTTWTSSGFNQGNPISAVAVAGSYLLVATGTAATPVVGAIHRMPLAGPYLNGTATAVLTAQEGRATPWNLVSYPDGVVFVGNYDSAGNGASQVRIRRSTDYGATWSVVLDLGVSDNLTRHVHSIVRHPTDTTKVWANIGDSGAACGNYYSSDSGATFTRIAAFGSIRLTPVQPVTDGLLWLSDQYRAGGNLFVQDYANTKLQPRSHVDAPWNGDGYAMSTKDSAGNIYYVLRYTNTSYVRTALFVTPDEGKTSFLVADFGNNGGYATALVRSGSYLFYQGLRYDVSGLDLT